MRASCSSSRGASPVDGDGRLVGGDDVVAQTRQVFANLGAILAAAGASFADVVKVTVFLTDIDDRARGQRGPAGGVRRRAAGEHARRGERARVPGRASRSRQSRSSRDRPLQRPHHGGRAAAALPGPLHGKRLLVKDLIDIAGIRTTYGSTIYADHVPARRRTAVQRLVAAGAVVVGKANLHEFAWGVTSQNPWYGTVQNPRAPGADDRRLVGRQRSGARRRPVRPRSRHRHGLLDPAAGVVLRRRRPEAELGPDPDGRRVSALPDVRHGRPDGAHGRRTSRSMWSVLAGAPVPEPRLAGLTVGLLTQPPSVGGAGPPENRAARAVRRATRGARCDASSRREIPEPPADTWPLFFHEAAEAHRATFPARADEYGDNVRAKLELAQAVDPDEVDSARGRSRVAHLSARRRPLRRAGARRRGAARRLRRARGADPR